MSLRMLTHLRSRLPANVILLRKRSAWNTSALCAAIVRRLAAALALHAAGHQAVLILDVHKCHLGADVLAACRARGIWPLFVPPKVTWFLQPLDVYAFNQFKLFLLRECLRARIRSRGGDASDVPRLIECLCNAIQHVLEDTAWEQAFDRCGFGQRQTALGNRVCSALQMGGVPCISDAQPTQEQLQRCFPKRFVVPRSVLLESRERRPISMARPIADEAVVGSTSTPTLLRRSARLAAMHVEQTPPPDRIAPSVALPAGGWVVRLRRRRHI